MGEDEILEESIRYVVAASKGLTNTYPEGWDKNMNRVNRVIVRGVDVVYKKKGKEEVFGVALAHGQDPATLSVDRGKMKGHLCNLPAPKRMDPFPTLQELKFKKKLPLPNF